jgi:hypothetical protein
MKKVDKSGSRLARVGEIAQVGSGRALGRKWEDNTASPWKRRLSQLSQYLR